MKTTYILQIGIAKVIDYAEDQRESIPDSERAVSGHFVNLSEAESVRDQFLALLIGFKPDAGDNT